MRCTLGDVLWERAGHRCVPPHVCARVRERLQQEEKKNCVLPLIIKFHVSGKAEPLFAAALLWQHAESAR